jgi:lipoprotein-releasing system permease protein
MPVPDREAEELPAPVAATPDPRGPGWYERAMEHYAAAPAARKRIPGEIRSDLQGDDDDWPDPVSGAGRHARFDASALPTIFVGATLARELGLKEDSLVMVVDPGSSFDTVSRAEFQHYRVVGVFQAGFQEYDSRLVYVHIKELQRFKYRGRDQVSGVDLRLTDPNLAPAVGGAIRGELPGREYSVLEWQNLNENLFKSIRFQKNIITIILSLVITVATFNVLSALWTMVVRRSAEVAILMSMGATGPPGGADLPGDRDGDRAVGLAGGGRLRAGAVLAGRAVRLHARPGGVLHRVVAGRDLASQIGWILA